MVVNTDIKVTRSNKKLCGAFAKKCTDRLTEPINKVVKILKIDTLLERWSFM